MVASRRTFRRGFTVIELLVSISIIGLLLALIMPAILSAREAGRMTQCRANFQGLGQSLHNFESSQGEFPPLMAGSKRERGSGGVIEAGSTTFLSPHVQLLPYLDQQVLFKQFDMDEMLYYRDDVIGTLPNYASTVLPVFLCPSDGGDFGNNYRFCTGQQSYMPGDGSFSKLRGVTCSRITDGLSNTAAASEALKSDDDSSSFGVGDYWISSLTSIVKQPTRKQVVDTCSSLSSNPSIGKFFPFVGHSWALSGYDFTLYNHAVAPNASGYDCSAEGRSTFTTWTTSANGVHKASSMHSGGVNLLLLDGSVRFIGNSISQEIWWSLASVNGNETLGSF